MVETRNTVRPNGTKSKEELLAQAKALQSRRQSNYRRTSTQSRTSVQKPVKPAVDKKELERQRRIKEQEEFERQQAEIKKQEEKARLEREKLRQAQIKKAKEEKERELAKKAKKVVKAKKSKYKKKNKKTLAQRGISKLKIRKTLGALFTLALLGVSGYTIYKSGLVQTAISDYKTTQYIKELEEQSNNTPVVDTPTDYNTDLVPAEETMVDEPVEEKHEVINTDMYDEGYEFNSNYTIDFLKSLNPMLSDNAAWLEIPGTKINYAFVHPSTENLDLVSDARRDADASGKSDHSYMASYFLHKDITQKDSSKGTLFLDINNNSLSNHMEDLTDVNTIYGHHMADGSMFQQLMNWKTDKNGTYNEQHPYAIIYTDDGYGYKVTFIASRVISGEDSSQLHNYNFDSYEEKCNYIQSIIDEAHQNGWFALDSYEVQPDDKFMNFVTCTYEYSNARYQLIGVMQKIKVRDSEYTDNQDGYYVEENSSTLNR